MDTLCILSDSISYNQVDQLYEVDCHIIIMQNDTLKILAGETVKFLSYPGGSPIRFELIIYGNLIAIGEKNKIITLGDPEVNFTSGNRWQGIKFINTSQNGESILKYCDIRGATNLEPYLETAILCENSSPIFDHCIFQFTGSGEISGGASVLGLIGNSYPIVMYSTFMSIHIGVAVWCNPYGFQDTINYPSPLMIGCNFKPSITGIYWPPCDGCAVLYGGFYDNCYFGVSSVFCDTTLGNPIDTIGDGICKTSSTFELKQRFILVDGVVNPRDTFLITGVDEYEIDILPTTSAFITLKNNFPNPFLNFTTIEFEIKSNYADISLVIYDSKGNLVRNLIKNKNYKNGLYSLNWHGDNDTGEKVEQGIYFYKLISNKRMLVKRAIVIK
jgi:hypothetical protein